MKPLIIKDMISLLPNNKIEQSQLQRWLCFLHTEAQSLHQNLNQAEKQKLYKDIESTLSSSGLGEDKISARYMQIDDMLFKESHLMPIYNLQENPMGRGLKEKMICYSKETDSIFSRFYQNTSPKEHLIHVSCTGYISPSAAQKIVAEKNTTTQVMHAYHMGCYGAIPALRMAKSATPCDIVHTELCSLHVNPLRSNKEQLIIESLFADGFIKYSIEEESEGDRGLRILSLYEEIIPDSSSSMTWRCEDWGFSMSLQKDVPVKIARHLSSFVDQLIAKCGLDIKDLKQSAIFAIHPGGPKIIDQVMKVLDIDNERVKHSKKTLYERGNMSSATLPHIWESISNDSSIPGGTYIVSLAFGPGLTICGAVLQKRC